MTNKKAFGQMQNWKFWQKKNSVRWKGSDFVPRCSNISDILSAIITPSHFLQSNPSQTETVFTKELIKINDKWRSPEKCKNINFFRQKKFHAFREGFDVLSRCPNMSDILC